MTTPIPDPSPLKTQGHVKPLTFGLPQPTPVTCRLKAPEYLSKQDRVHGMYYPSPSGLQRIDVGGYWGPPLFEQGFLS